MTKSKLLLILLHPLLLPLGVSAFLFSKSFAGRSCTSLSKPVRSVVLGRPSTDDNDEGDLWVDNLDPSIFEDDRDDKLPSSPPDSKFSDRRPPNPRQRQGASRFDDGRRQPNSRRQQNTQRGGNSPQRRRRLWHDYERDWSADDSRVDEDTVNALISDRLQARKTGQYDVADEIREELLRDHGVSVWDKERLWRSGCSPSGSGSRWGSGNYGGGGGGRRQRDRRPGGGRPDRFNDRGGGRRRRTNFGPNGHDYFLSADAGPSTSPMREEEIHKLLAERLQCKLSRNYRDADAIENELHRNGVFVHDGYKEWRADGVRFGSFQGGGYGPKPGRQAGSRADRNRPYQMSQYSEGDIANEHKEDIQQLVQERATAKTDRNYNVADAIRENLRSDYNVEIDDRKREWSVGGVFGKPPGPYEMSVHSQPIESLVTANDGDEAVDTEAAQSLRSYIQNMIDERDQARADRDFNTADNIQEELREVYNIELLDRDREWSIGGKFHGLKGNNHDGGTRETWGEGLNQNDESFEYTRRGGGSLTEEQIAIIDSQLQERMECKLQKQFGKADRIRDRLMSEFKIRVDDRNKEWHVVTNEYGQGRSSGGLDQETLDYIQAQINERAVAKLEKDYEKADSIRDTLMDQYAVSIDDRLKEWNVITDNPLEENVLDEKNGVGVETQNIETHTSVDNEINVDEGSGHGEEIEEAGEDDTAASLESLTVVQLKDLLRTRGLPVSGRKAELIERLQQ